MSEIKKIFIESAHMRCKPNAVLTSSIARYIKANEHKIVRDLSAADYVLLNTCGFTSDQEQMCVDFFKDAKAVTNAEARFISLGCLNKINKNCYVDAGLDDVMILEREQDLDEYLARVKNYEDLGGRYLDDEVIEDTGIEMYPTGVLYSDKFRNIIYKLERWKNSGLALGLLFRVIDQRNKVFVEIAKGCTGNCSYCIIKKAKGHIVSRPVEEIIEDVRKKYQPCKTLYLVGDDCASYGVDSGSSITELVNRIHQYFPDLAFNINYFNATLLERQYEQLKEMFKNVKISSINITLQSGSARIIKAMNRKYDPRKIVTMVRQLREISPDTVFLTHMLLGFPGERWRDFFSSLSIMHLFDATSVFPYSAREGTQSELMTNNNSGFTIKLRGVLTRIYSLSLIFLRTLKDFIAGR